MSSSTWCLYWVSEISMPATNAPSAIDRPARSVIQAAPSVTSSRLSMNSSCERRLATMVNHLRISFWPKNSSSTSTAAALTPAQARVMASSSAGLRQRRDQDQQRHHGQVLEQQDADDAPSVLAFQFQPLGQQLGDDRGGRHRQRAAQRERGLPADVQRRRQRGRQQPAEHHGGDDGQHHLRQPEPEHDAAHRRQLGQREFEADREHQEHHAEFGQRVGGGAVVGQAQRVRADQTPTAR